MTTPRLKIHAGQQEDCKIWGRRALVFNKVRTKLQKNLIFGTILLLSKAGRKWTPSTTPVSMDATQH